MFFSCRRSPRQTSRNTVRIRIITCSVFAERTMSVNVVEIGGERISDIYFSYTVKQSVHATKGTTQQLATSTLYHRYNTEKAKKAGNIMNRNSNSTRKQLEQRENQVQSSSQSTGRKKERIERENHARPFSRDTNNDRMEESGADKTRMNEKCG